MPGGIYATNTPGSTSGGNAFVYKTYANEMMRNGQVDPALAQQLLATMTPGAYQQQTLGATAGYLPHGWGYNQQARAFYGPQGQVITRQGLQAPPPPAGQQQQAQAPVQGQTQQPAAPFQPPAPQAPVGQQMAAPPTAPPTQEQQQPAQGALSRALGAGPAQEDQAPRARKARSPLLGALGNFGYA